MCEIVVVYDDLFCYVCICFFCIHCEGHRTDVGVDGDGGIVCDNVVRIYV